VESFSGKEMSLRIIMGDRLGVLSKDGEMTV
jgi:hypothetical protein